MKKRSVRAMVLFGGLLLVVWNLGCAPRQDRKAWQIYADRLEPAVGQAKVDEFIGEWGMPHQQIPLSEGRAYGWHFSKGRQSAGIGYVLSVGHSYEKYDRVTLIFDENKVLREWKADCVR